MSSLKLLFRLPSILVGEPQGMLEGVFVVFEYFVSGVALMSSAL